MSRNIIFVLMYHCHKLLDRLFIFGLFNDTFSSTDCMGSSGRMIKEWWIREDMEGSGCGQFQDTILEFAQKDRKAQKSLSPVILSVISYSFVLC
jgi:hypothetical protein